MQIKIFILLLIIIQLSCNNVNNLDEESETKYKSEMNIELENLKTLMESGNTNILRQDVFSRERLNFISSSIFPENNLVKLVTWALILDKTELVKYIINEYKININKIYGVTSLFEFILDAGNFELVKYFINRQKAHVYTLYEEKKYHIVMTYVKDKHFPYLPEYLLPDYIHIINFFYLKKMINLKELNQLYESSSERAILLLHKYLLSIGTNINLLNSFKENSLILAVRYGGINKYTHSIHVRNCFNCSKPESQNSYYNYYKGTQYKRLVFIKYLLKNKININQIDDKSKTALDYSLKILNESEKNEIDEGIVVKFLKKHGAKRACEILKTKCKDVKVENTKGDK